MTSPDPIAEIEKRAEARSAFFQENEPRFHRHEHQAHSDCVTLLQALAASQARVKELESGATVSLHQAWGYAKEHPSECAQGYDKEAFSHVQFWMERAAKKGTP